MMKQLSVIVLGLMLVQGLAAQKISNGYPIPGDMEVWMPHSISALGNY